MAERNSLLNCRTGNGTEGSNPSLSAMIERNRLFKHSEGLFYVQKLVRDTKRDTLE